MTNELIKINYNNNTPMASARDLHEKLEIKTQYTKWFERMCEYGFTENIDFLTISQKRLTAQGNVTTFINHDISVDMAKQICMLQRSDKGKQYRQYFLDLEKAWNTPEQVMARALKLADQTIKSLEIRNSELEKEVQSKTILIEEQKPFVDFATHVSKSSDTIDIGDFSKIANQENINIGRNRLFKFLRDEKILMQNNIPYQKYIERKWFEVVETCKNTPYGTKVFPKTLISGKGQIALIELLRKEFLECTQEN